MIDRFELVAQDGEGSQNVTLSNDWGGHQMRVTRHSDGSVRLLYMKTNSTAQGPLEWRVLRRDPAGGWTAEASGISNDDVYLMRDPTTDLPHVVAWPAGKPTIYSGPAYRAHAVPGTWPYRIAPKSRGYAGAGIGPDGTFCLKVSREDFTIPETAHAYTDYICGKHSVAASAWAWHGQNLKYIGLRHGYDFIFPGAGGANGSFVAMSEPNLHKDAAGMPHSGETYIFNGVRMYGGDVQGAANWFQTNVAAPIPVPSISQSTRPPVERPNDNFVDSRQRMLSTYFAEDPLNSTVRGHYLAVSDLRGNVLFKGKLAVPTYGKTRIFEDSKGRLWVLWTAARPTLTSMWLYALSEGGTASAPTFAVGSAPTVLDAALSPYSVQGNPHLAVPRAGSSIGNAVEGKFVACDGIYQAGITHVCYPNGTTGKQRIFSFRLRLPD